MNQKFATRLKSLLTPNSLRVQLLSRTLLIMAVLLALIGIFQYVFMKEVIYRNKAESMQSQLISFYPAIWERLGSIKENGDTRLPRFFFPETELAFIDTQGNYTVLSNGPDGLEPPRLGTQEYMEFLNRRPMQDTRPEPRSGAKLVIRSNFKVVESGGVEQLLVLQPVFEHGQNLGIVQVSTKTGPLTDLLLRQLFTFLFLSLAAMIFGLLAFLPVLRRTLDPLSNMVDTAGQIDAGNLDKRFPTNQGQVEIDRLAESFNGMLERLEASFEAEKETQEQMRRFISDASHELRTPLTSIRGFLEVLLRGAADQPEQLHKALNSMHGESVRLTKLVHDLLLLSKLDREPNIDLKEGRLDTVFEDMEPQLRILAGGRKLDLDIEPEIICSFDTDKMKQVVLNLFHNAVQHTDPEKGQIRISLAKMDSGVQLTVRDNGPGISESHLPHVFDRFYRSDSSRTRKYGGAGLGLAITRSIVNAHGGTISVESKEGEGCTFIIWLP
ncbi:ATP-binding protein [Pelotomaculum propionicicum]|uniref:sensor histidine kinase n=1 Tax=Pelotomaculum propionicicum TaxID=258475 RepID=UPI003B794761